MEELIPVVITGKHPHSGEKGHIASYGGKIEKHLLPGYGEGGAYKVQLDDPTFAEACFASSQNVRITRNERTSVRRKR